MKTLDFNYNLPGHLIAQYPPEKRGQSRLLTLDRVTGKHSHSAVCALPEILCGRNFLGADGQKPLLVFNNSKVRKARLFAQSSVSGVLTEFLLLERVKNREAHIETQPPAQDCWKVLTKRARQKKKGSGYFFYDGEGKKTAGAKAAGFEDDFLILEFDRLIDDDWLDKYGHIPLPPYIKREDKAADAERYQTVYAKEYGSSAAPTAGLHFTCELLDSISQAGIESAFVTLHVGLGTFLSVRSVNIEDHVMHSETFSIDEQTALKIEKAKEQGRKITAVGTTSVRTLESAWEDGRLKRGEGSTSVFIYPGFKFRAVDAIFTNFHTPESTLLMLVCAFAGRQLILDTYAEAVREGYRFFSYGDAMLIR
ncbi:MAG: tRNA preQ1(34) S-adenosylmethionine ribosyltransferase-isomerase QueA [Treponema sp.]|jgi:S-adenosylmethionine:tRNA ribosyltransferase-isomerase|nr:tRNA preQ1(34) S-adenosylmethionine ribosyltransferase-isomerase QueA [Treponema sp.]